MRSFPWVGIAVLAASMHLGAEDAKDDTCLLFAARCLAKGTGNFFMYYKFADDRVEIENGDRLEYDVYLSPDCPLMKGGIDAQLAGGGSLRDSAATDQDGLRAHGDALLDKARGRWLHRVIDLAPIAGHTTDRWDLVFEGDAPGLYAQFVDAVAVVHADGSRYAIYANGKPSRDDIDWKEGYSQDARTAVVPRADVVEGEAVREVIDRELRVMRLASVVEERREELAYVIEVLRRSHREDLVAEVEEAASEIPDPGSFEGTVEDLLNAIHRSDHRLAHAHPVMRDYTGHLVGHAHIDFQWLWEWPEGIQAARDTFGQATRFMEEFPEFTFSQSSAALYVAMEENDPPLFQRIRERAKSGQWEVVGGRWCEGDTNTISGESHARHFLYGQRYFREKVGASAKVGWEPDTFGHSWAMPQMLKQAGIDTYYFCRGGKGKPLFWWEGPDGSRVLAFEEPAIQGGWYNSDVGRRQLQELLEFRDVTGSHDMLWVYGVGNHGGGPTRENILTALGWQQKDLPNVKFSTATQFFEAIRKQGLSNLPVVRDELNPVFEGTYTTHSDMKRWNRDLEVLLGQAETTAAIAVRFGVAYPREAIVATWKDLLWNHHHDTLPGTAIHASYKLSRSMYEKGIAEMRRVVETSSSAIAAKIGEAREGDLVVVNTLGWRRDAVVRVAPRTGLPEGSLVAVAPDGGKRPVQRVDDALVFVARDLPAFGYRVYRIEAGEGGDLVGVEGTKLTTPALIAEMDDSAGLVTRLVDRATGRELLGHPGNLLEVSTEAPHGGSAWTIGEIRGVEPPGHLEPAQVVDRGPVLARVRTQLGYHKSRITVEEVAYRDLDLLEVDLTVEWKEKGDARRGGPFLRTSFPFAVTDAHARYAIPFGDIERPMDGHECAALEWADVSGAEGGVALLNDCKHGHSAKGSTLTLSLIRSSYEPDPEPDVGMHVIRYALLPHAGDPREARVPYRAAEFNTPPIALWAAKGEGELPLEKSFLSVEGALPTALKMSEDGDAWVVRFYNPANAVATASVPGLEKATEVNFVEDPIGQADPSKISLRPYEVKTLRFEAR